MKSILFFIPTLGGGGAERVLVNLVNNLDKTKYKITVQTLFDAGVNKEMLAGHIEYCSNFKYVIPANTKLFKLFSPKFLYNRLIGRKYDIAVSYLEGPTERIIAGCPYSGTKLVNWIHVEQHTVKCASYSYRNFKEAQRCIDEYDRTICVAETVKDDILNIFHFSHPCEVLYNTNENDKIIGLAKESIANDIYSKDGFNVVSVGRLIEQKGYDRLINVHKRLLKEGIKHHIYIVGAGELEDKLKDQAQSLGVEGTFHFLGFHKNPYKYIAKADMFVCSSRREGFSTAVTEALLLGLPVVSTNCSGAYELLGKNNEYGIVTENSEEGIYEGIKRMFLNETTLVHYREQSTIRAPKFSKAETLRAVERMLSSLSDNLKQ